MKWEENEESVGSAYGVRHFESTIEGLVDFLLVEWVDEDFGNFRYGIQYWTVGGGGGDFELEADNFDEAVEEFRTVWSGIVRSQRKRLAIFNRISDELENSE